MATGFGKSQCATCGKGNAILKCGGCSKDFCYNHFGDHRQQLNTQLEEVEVNRDLFRQTLSEQAAEPQKHSLIQQIHRWERDSIRRIQQTAEKARQTLLQHSSTHIRNIEVKLNKLTDQLRQGRKENDFVETDLRHWNKQLTELTEELNKPPNISLRHDSKPFVTGLYVEISSQSINMLNIDVNTRWRQKGVTVAGGNGQGNGLNQLDRPIGIYVDDDQTIYIADQWNHRIVEWKDGANSSKIVAGGNGKGSLSGQLSGPYDVVLHKESNSLIITDYGNRRVMCWPRQNGTNGQIIISNIACNRLIIDRNGYLYVSNIEKHEVSRWRMGDTTGTVVAGGNGQGDRLNQLNEPTHIFVDEDQSVYVSDWGNNRVMKWRKGSSEGIIVAGGRGEGNGLSQLSSPQGVIVDQLGTVYVADFKNDRIMRWYNGATEGSILVGGSGKGKQSNQLNCPQSMSFDRHGNLYVVDQHNHRVQKFHIDSN